jgi:hypothetical protein
MQPDDNDLDADWEDPIVAEIHEICAQLLAEFDGDVSAYYAHIQQLEEEKRKRGVYYREVPARDLPKPDAA